MGAPYVVESGHIGELDRGKVFTAPHIGHMTGGTAALPVGIALSKKLGLLGVAILALLFQRGLGKALLPVIGGDGMGVVAGTAAHAFLVVDGVVHLRTLGAAGGAG